MDKLKTLKELEVDDRLFQKAMIESNLIPIRMNKSDIEGTFFELTKPFVMSSELRQEAIKWIKNFRTMKSTTQQDLEINQYSWMEFFNIKEEELK